MQDYVFGYASLMNRSSLRTAIPTAHVEELIPARVHGFVRRWNVAFPNDGSQRDKVYRDSADRRPSFVLFVNLDRVLEESPRCVVNGILIPVGPQELRQLAQRERRYLEVDVTESTEAHGAPFDRSRCRVFAFVGRPSFIRDEDVRRGVIDRRYLHCISEGVSQWEERFPGFQNEFERSTELDASVPIADLTRMDL